MLVMGVLIVFGMGPRMIDGRQPDCKTRTLAEFRFNHDFVAQQVSQATDDRQSEAEAFLAAAFRLDLVELLENVLLLVFADADARVPDLDAATAIALAAIQLYLAPVGVADRSGEQVLDECALQVRVGTHHGTAR